MNGRLTPFPRCAYARPLSNRAIDRLPSNPGRSSAVHSLVESLDLLEVERASTPDSLNRARVIGTGQASREELEAFHDREYVEFLLNPKKGQGSENSSTDGDSCESDTSETRYQVEQQVDIYHKKDKKVTSQHERPTFGLEHDCLPFPELPQYVKAVAGASLAIARELREGRADIGMAWDGGRHHAQQANASGFCYVNDVVLSIMELRRRPQDKTQKKVDKVLYVDLDVHHGDGVEAAFYSTSRVLTISVHYHDPKGGFFPLTEAVVLQCGVDGLAGDPLGGRFWGLGLHEMGNCVAEILHETSLIDCKVLLFGGGGYHRVNAARAWAYFTSIALGRQLLLNADIPPGAAFYMEYGPSFTLEIPAIRTSPALPRISEEEFETTCARLDAQLIALRARYNRTARKIDL